MKLWVHASILKSAALADAADKNKNDDTITKKFNRLDSSNCSIKSPLSSDGLSTRKEQWVWVLSEVVSGSTQDLFATSSCNDNNLTSPRHDTINSAATNSNATLTVRVVDPESDYADRIIEISREHINMGDGGRGVLPANTFEDNQPLPSDLTQLTHLHEPAVLDCLHRRYQLPSGWEMYTSSGPILIAINPCRMVKALYDESTMKLYQRHGEQLANGSSSSSASNKLNGDDQGSSSPPPHVFAVADSAYRGMMRGLDFARNKNSTEEMKESSALSNQSILVSGESGAGKTVTTKFLMQYLADLSRKVHSDNTVSGGRKLDQSSIEQRVLNSNPILEAFGNARTLRNDNSSRFGKFIEMRFSDRGRLHGAYIDTYLLEKARIVSHTSGEQTYHIFYQLLAKGSMAEDLRRQLMIEDTTTADYAITTSVGSQNNSKLFHNEFGDHCKMFLELQSAMSTLSFSQNERMEIFQVVCALLHLSNLTLDDAFVDINDGEECKLDDKNHSLQRALSLLGVSYEALDSAVTTVQFKAVDELVTKNLSSSQAAQAVQALIKGVYDSIFTILVGRINSCIAGASATSDTENDSGGSFIGLLDIFGFETFQKNVFEQFCINYCNESLQQQFNRFVFKLEQQEYIREGIRWDMIDFQDNQDTLDLIEKKNAGILTILDEQCRLGMRCNDKTFVSAVYSKCMTGNNRFGADRKQQSHGKFTIRHYAGVVEYSTDGFMEKNKDEIPMETSELLSQSTCAFVRDIAQVISAKTGNQTESKSSISRVSVGKQFSGQLQKLRRRIDETHPHYVRCIKPNEQLQPNHFDANIVVDQLRCGGILEAIRVSRAGFSQRYTFEHFLARFSVLSSVIDDKKEFIAKERKLNKSSNGISTKMKRSSKTRATIKEECKTLVKMISQWILKEKMEKLDEAERNLNASSETVSPRFFWTNKEVGEASKSGDIVLSEAGIQVGATKVFLIQDTFDTIERLRGQVTMINATKIACLVRMYLTRKAYLQMLRDHRQARAQRRALFEANPFVSNSRKYKAADENLLGRVDANVEGYEIVANGERDAMSNPDPTDFIWHSIGHGRFVKKREGEDGGNLMEATSTEESLLEQQQVEDIEKQDLPTPSRSTPAEQQPKRGSSVSQLVFALGEKNGKQLTPVSPMSFWSSQSSPRASDDNAVEANRKAKFVSRTNTIDKSQTINHETNSNLDSSSFSSKKVRAPHSSPRNAYGAKKELSTVSSISRIKADIIQSQSIKSDEENTDTNSSNQGLGPHSSPRTLFDGGNVIEAKKKLFAASSISNVNAGVSRPQVIKPDKQITTCTHSSKVRWGSQPSPLDSSNGKIVETKKNFSAGAIVDEINDNEQTQNVKSDEASTNDELPKSFCETRSSPRAYSGGGNFILETKQKLSAVSDIDKNNTYVSHPVSVKADSKLKTVKVINPTKDIWGARSDDRNAIEGISKANVSSSMNYPNSAGRLQRNRSDEEIIGTNQSKVVCGTQSKPKAEVKNINLAASSEKSTVRQKKADATDVTQIFDDSNVFATNKGWDESDSPRTKLDKQAAPGAEDMKRIRTKANGKSTMMTESSPWQKSTPVKSEQQTFSRLSSQSNDFPNHFRSITENQTTRDFNMKQRGRGAKQNLTEKRQDSSIQNFGEFGESSFAPNSQFNSFKNVSSPRFEEQLSPSSTLPKNVSVAARRRAKAMNAVTMVDSMTTSYKQARPTPAKTPTTPKAPAIAPPPLSTSARARRNMKQKMHRNHSRVSESPAESDFVDF